MNDYWLDDHIAGKFNIEARPSILEYMQRRRSIALYNGVLLGSFLTTMWTVVALACVFWGK